MEEKDVIRGAYEMMGRQVRGPPAFDASASMFGEPEPEPERVPSPDSWMPGPGASAPQVMEAVDDDVEDLQPEPQPEAAAGGQTEVPAVRVDL